MLAVRIPAKMRRSLIASLALATSVVALQAPRTSKCVRRVAVSVGKETTWDRLTGPKLFKSVKKTEGIHAVPLVPLRVLTGVLMMHHGSEGGFWPANYGTPGFDGFVDFIVKPRLAGPSFKGDHICRKKRPLEER